MEAARYSEMLKVTYHTYIVNPDVRDTSLHAPWSLIRRIFIFRLMV